MSSEQLRIAGFTGVELTLDIAGPGTRSYAFVIDWHIRVLLALAWVLGGLVLIRVLGAGLRGSLWIQLPAALIYFLYHPVLEVAMRGRTPGKRMAGVRIVTRQGGTPDVGALLLRNLLRLVDMLPGLYVVGLVCCFMTQRRVRIGDIAAGTLLVIDARNATEALARVGAQVAQSGLPPATVELIQDLLERWPQLAPQPRSELTRAILTRVDASATLEALDEAQLKQRLQALLTADKASSP